MLSLTHSNVGAKLKPIFAEAAKERMLAGKANPEANLPQGSRAQQSRDEAAEAVNVSPRTVQSAETVLTQGAPELIREVERGNVAVSTAVTIARLPKEEQASVVSGGSSAIRERAKELKQQKEKPATLPCARCGKHFSDSQLVEYEDKDYCGPCFDALDQEISQQQDEAAFPIETCTGETDTCPIGECMVCGERDCPSRDRMHYHHDGCPSCGGAYDEPSPEITLHESGGVSGTGGLSTLLPLIAAPKGAPAIMASQRDDHNTPPEILAIVRAFAGGEITLDPCHNPDSQVQARHILGREQDGLHVAWGDYLANQCAESLTERQLVFVNPPYDQKTLLDVHMAAVRESSDWLDVITLPPVKSDQEWFQWSMVLADAVCLIAGRVRFWVNGEEQQGAAFCSCLFYFGGQPARFCDLFGALGVCINIAQIRGAQ